MCPTDPVGLEAVARRMPTAALVAVLAERGEPGDVSAEDLEEMHGLGDQESVSAFMTSWQMRHGRTNTTNVCGNPQSAWEFYAAMQTIVPRLAREVVILRALAAHKLPCGHALENIVYGGPDLNGLPAVAQCGQCLADRQKAKATLPRTPHAVLTAMSRAYTAARFAAHVAALRATPGTAEETAAFALLKRLETWRLAVENEAASEAALGEDYGTDWTDDVLAADYEARLAGTRPLDAPPMEAP